MTANLLKQAPGVKTEKASHRILSEKTDKHKNNSSHGRKILFFKTVLSLISFKGEKSKFPEKNVSCKV